MSPAASPAPGGAEGAGRERDAARRAAGLKAALALALACGFALSRRLWVASPRDFPTVPLFAWLPRVPFPVDYLWLAALLVLLALIFVSKRPQKFIVAFLALAVPLALWDQTRWQPWFYQYLFMLAALALYPWGAGEGTAEAETIKADKADATLDACRLVVAFIYFWSGVQKAHANFSVFVLLRPYLPEAWALAVSPAVSVLVPLSEIAVGVGLLTRRFRDAAVVLALAVHASVLLLFVPVRANNVIWPWNVAMCAFVVLLFWRERGFGLRELLLLNRRALNLVAALLFAVMPALSFFGWWDSYLSAALYSGNLKEGFIYFGPAVRDRLPERARGSLKEVSPGRYLLNPGVWARRALNVPAYPEPRAYRRLAAWVCTHADAPTDVTLEIQDSPHWLTGQRRSTFYDCQSLKSN